MADLRNGERTWNAYDESWEFGCPTEECEHLSASGIDQADMDDPDKVWRCDACGWLYRSVRPEDAPPMVRVMRGLNAADRAPHIASTTSEKPHGTNKENPND